MRNSKEMHWMQALLKKRLLKLMNNFQVISDVRGEGLFLEIDIIHKTN
ncbi:hypothetical protein OA955_00705 [Candidatus Marinimicrobia bacterium]|nr:hypothetical protein [Candidatus Neomarinimicrobiota bacterium]